MATSKIAQFEHFYQQVTDRFNTTARRFSQAWLEFEFTREALQQLTVAHRLLIEEQEAQAERHKQQRTKRDQEDIF